MLYDPKWEKQSETKADPFTLVAVIAWLEKQPPDKSYDWMAVHGCLACQYFQSLGHDAPWGNSHAIVDGGYRTPFGGSKNYHAIAGAVPWTFGAALERARKLAV